MIVLSIGVVILIIVVIIVTALFVAFGKLVLLVLGFIWNVIINLFSKGYFWGFKVL